MKRRDAIISLVVILVANLVPLFGVMFLGWQLANIMLGYWLETVVIVFFTFLKILSSKKLVNRHEFKITYHPDHGFNFHLFDRADYAVEFLGKSLALLAFLFILIVLIFFPDFLYQVFKGDITGNSLSQAWSTVAQWFIPAASLFIAHLYSFILNYFFNKEYLAYSPKELMVMPFRRIVGMELVLLVGGYLVLHYGVPIYYLASLIGLKIILDLIAHLEEHKVIQPSSGDDLLTDVVRYL